MPAHNVVLLDEARAKRAKAEHVRALCQTLFDTRAIEALRGYADELDQQAAELERRVERTGRLAAEITDEIAKATKTLAQITDTLRRD